MKRPVRRRFQTWLGTIALLAMSVLVADAQLIGLGDIFLQGSSPGFLDLVDTSGAHVKFKYTGVKTDSGPNFIIVIPSSGTTPASVQIALNPNVVPQLTPSATYALTVQFATVDQTPASTTSGVVTYKVPAEPPPAIQSVVN